MQSQSAEPLIQIQVEPPFAVIARWFPAPEGGVTTEGTVVTISSRSPSSAASIVGSVMAAWLVR